MPTAPRAFLANSGPVWATALRPVPPKKGLVTYMPVRWGVHQIPQINIGLTPLQVSGSTSAGRVIRGTDLAECVSVPGDFLRPQGAFPPGFYLRRGRRHFWEMPGACGLRPTIKKALCHTCPLGGAVNKYRRSLSVLSEQYETSYLFYVTLSFLCNIICYLISVFVFSLVTLSGATTICLSEKIQRSAIHTKHLFRIEESITKNCADTLLWICCRKWKRDSCYHLILRLDEY